MERELPTVNIEGTDFFVDVIKNELKEKAEELASQAQEKLNDLQNKDKVNP